jgi:hypothetical protein
VRGALEHISAALYSSSAAATSPPAKAADGRRDRSTDRLKRQTVDVVQVPAGLDREAPPELLDDAAVQRFIETGVLLVNADFGSAPVHADIFGKLEEAFALDGNDGANVLPRVPEIQRAYDHPRVRGALQSLLGEGYAMHPNRFPHLRLGAAGAQPGQDWHKDGYVFDHQLRTPRYRWVFACECCTMIRILRT